MQKLLLLLISLMLSCNAFCQHFFDTDFDKKEKYIILCDPTINRIRTIEYLTQNNILRIKKNVKFVGVYYKNQKYDFNKTKNYIENNHLENFYLHEVEGKLNGDNIYKETNPVSDDMRKIFYNSIGVIFFGGPDIQPALYGQENTASVVTDPERHYFECSFMFHLLGGYNNKNYKPLLNDRPNYVVTGFCLGMQTMNVGTGGSMIQDIPSEIYNAHTPEETVKIGQANLHRNYWQLINNDTMLCSNNMHTIQFTDNPFFGKKVKVNKQFTPYIYSHHHQAVKKLGENLEVTALSPDGKIIEGIAHAKFNGVFAVQFHPEVSALYDNKQQVKLTPQDKPRSFHEIIGKKGAKFHKAYWKYISKAFGKAAKEKKH